MTSILKIIADKQEIKGIALWLIAYQTYSVDILMEDLSGFLNEWFPTVQKDWDDMEKFHGNHREILRVDVG